eukprot:2844317-Amphidinium_carterae.2
MVCPWTLSLKPSTYREADTLVSNVMSSSVRWHGGYARIGSLVEGNKPLEHRVGDHCQNAPQHSGQGCCTASSLVDATNVEHPSRSFLPVHTIHCSAHTPYHIH